MSDETTSSKRRWRVTSTPRLAAVISPRLSKLSVRACQMITADPASVTKATSVRTDHEVTSSPPIIHRIMLSVR
jgi:hypothetical protein